MTRSKPTGRLSASGRARVVAWILALKTGEITGFVQHSILFNLPYFGAGLVAYRLYRLRQDLAF